MKNETYEKLCKVIASQQGKPGTPEFNIGEQLKVICKNSSAAAEIVLTDLKNKDMKLSVVAKKFKQYADKKHGSEKCFCITPDTAEKLICDFYGISDEMRGESPENSDHKNNIINLEDLI